MLRLPSCPVTRTRISAAARVQSIVFHRRLYPRGMTGSPRSGEGDGAAGPVAGAALGGEGEVQDVCGAVVSFAETVCEVFRVG